MMVSTQVIMNQCYWEPVEGSEQRRGVNGPTQSVRSTLVAGLRAAGGFEQDGGYCNVLGEKG